MRILLVGIKEANNLIFIKLIKSLTANKNEVIVLTDNISKTSKYIPVHHIEYCNILEQVSTIRQIDCIINLTQQSLNHKTFEHNNLLNNHSTQNNILNDLCVLITRLKHKPTTLINTGLLDINNINNQTNAPTDQALLKILANGTKVKIINFGIILNNNDGLIKKLSFIFKHTIGLHNPSDTTYVPWIHIDDVIKAMLFLIQNNNLKEYSVYNLAAPYPNGNLELSKLLVKHLHNKFFIKLPILLLYLLVNKRHKQYLSNNNNLLATSLLEEGFCFDYPTLNLAIKDLIK